MSRVVPRVACPSLVVCPVPISWGRSSVFLDCTPFSLDQLHLPCWTSLVNPLVFFIFSIFRLFFFLSASREESFHFIFSVHLMNVFFFYFHIIFFRLSFLFPSAWSSLHGCWPCMSVGVGDSGILGSPFLLSLRFGFLPVPVFSASLRL